MKKYQNLLISITIFVCYVALFSTTILSMITLWSTSETYTHGFVIVPIVVWLLYRDRTYFLAYQAKASWLGLLFTIAALLLWLVGQTFEVSVFSQLGAVGGIAASHWMVFGDRFAKRYQFPLFYLIFAVPMGNMLIPYLQQVTAEITVYMLQLSSIPVFFEGLYITIPTGKFEVAVACSGIRYLIASVAVGTLYAYLSYRKLYKQLIFVAFALVVPIVANGLRAYLVVLIAHLSEMKYATGVDHLIYGWLFFGLVIMIMFYVGGFFIDPESEDDQDGEITTKYSDSKYNPLPAIFALVLAGSLVLMNHNIDTITPPSQASIITSTQILPLSPVELKSWGIKFDHAMAKFSGISSQNIEVFVAQYANRQTVGELITSTNKVYNPGRWSLLSTAEGKVTTPGGDINYTQLDIVSSNGQQRVVRYWYYINHKILASKSQAKINQAYLALLNSKVSVYIYAVSKSYDADNQSAKAINNELNQWITKHSSALLKGDIE